MTGFYTKRFCTENYFLTDYSTDFFKEILIFKKQSNVDSLNFFPFDITFQVK